MLHPWASWSYLISGFQRGQRQPALAMLLALCFSPFSHTDSSGVIGEELLGVVHHACVYGGFLQVLRWEKDS